MVGIGNIVGILTALQLGGPGVLPWMWLAAFIGSLLKYCEVYLGLKYRVRNHSNGYDGGPMYFVQKAFTGNWLPIAICFLLCIYGAEIYQFKVVLDVVATNWALDRVIVLLSLLALVLYAASGGIARVAKLCSWLLPLFMSVYIIMCIWIIGHHISALPHAIATALLSAFSGHAATGAFMGSTLSLAIQHGMAGACYSADIGIGYDSIIHSESRSLDPDKQARLAILGVIVDNFLSTISVVVLLLTGGWQEPMTGAFLMQQALDSYFPAIHIIFPIFLFVLGYTTLISYFTVGLKCAQYIHPAKGRAMYFFYASSAFILFSFVEQQEALLIMRFAGALLLIINLCSIFRLRREIAFV